MHIGFSTASLVPAVPPPWRVHDPLHVRTLVVEQAGRVVLVLAALDLLNLAAARARDLRRTVADRFGLAEHRVILHITHTHSAPNQHHLDAVALQKALLTSVQRARKNAQPARLAFRSVHTGSTFSKCRRWSSRSDLGTVTVIDNSGCVFREGDVFVRDYLRAELARLGHADFPVPEDARLPAPGDNELSLLHFIDTRGRSLGGLARFAAHPDQVAGRLGSWLSAEFPGYLCRKLQRALGGTFLYLNGPCGDLKLNYQDHTWAACRAAGESLANLLLKQRPARRAYRPLTTLTVHADQLHLPTRTDLPRDAAPLTTEMFELRSQESTLGHRPLRQAKQRYERRWTADGLVFTANAYYDGEVRRMFAPRPCLLQLVSFNRDTRYLCLPDEQFAGLTRQIRTAFRTQPGLQTVSMCGGAEWYLAPAREIAHGGYEPTFSIYAPESYDQVARAAITIAQRAARGGREVWSTDELAGQLRRSGVRRGDIVLVHSALRSCGYLEGGADGLLHGLLQAVGSEGTVLFPTLTGARTDHPDRALTFDRRNAPCWTGALPQRALSWPGAVRSFHPTHSCVAIGPAAEALTQDHENSVTPVDERSPYQQVVRHGGKFLIIGLDLKCLTLVHGQEEQARRPDPCHKRPTPCLMIDGDRREIRPYRLHDWSVVAPDYERYRPALRRARAIRPVRIGDAAGWLLDGPRAWRALASG